MPKEGVVAIAPRVNRFKWRGVIVLAGVLLGLSLAALPVGATPLGVNGRIAWDNPNGAGTVYTANSDGTHVLQVTDANSCCAAWSPDGSRLLVSGPNSDGMIATSILNADGTDFHTLPLLTPGLGLACTVWSPNGKYCAAQGGSPDPSVNASVEGVYRVNVNNGSAVRLTSGNDIPGDYSPDGSKIVFGRYDANGNGLALYIINANGTGLHRLITEIFQPVNDGSWSPQGNQIVFSRHVTANVPGSIWVINSDGTGLHQINVQGLNCGKSVGCHEPQWSPDGKRIIFAANTAQGTFVYTMSADGTGLEKIAAGDDPVWGTHPDVASTSTWKGSSR
jgi:Tol biopolymer transport system component